MVGGSTSFCFSIVFKLVTQGRDVSLDNLVIGVNDYALRASIRSQIIYTSNSHTYYLAKCINK